MSKYANTPLVRYLLEVMESRQWSGNELAKRAGLASPSFWEIVTGATKAPALDTIVGLAEACEVDPVVLFYLATGRQPQGGLDTTFEELRGIFDRLDGGGRELLLRLARTVSNHSVEKD